MEFLTVIKTKSGKVVAIQSIHHDRMGNATVQTDIFTDTVRAFSDREAIEIIARTH